MFFSINKGKIKQYNAQDGSLISDFGMRQIYTKSNKLTLENNDEEFNNSYVIHLTDKRNYLFTIVDETRASHKDGTTSINRIINKYSSNRKRAQNEADDIT